MATALDPRFKSRPFTNKTLLLTMLPDWVQSIAAVPVLNNAPVPEPVQTTSVADDDNLLVSYTDAQPYIVSAGLEQVHN
jgi:hypothetical protein